MTQLLILLAVLCTTGCLIGIVAAIRRVRRVAHLANAGVLGLAAAGAMLAAAINSGSGVNVPGVLLVVALAGFSLACVHAARRDAGWAVFWAGWLLSAATAGSLLYLWLGFRIRF